MNDLEFFVERWKQEYPAFVRVYRALPEGRLDYSPHPASRSARRIAWGLAEEVRSVNEILETGESRWPDAAPPSSAAELVAAFERHGSRLTALAERLDDAQWASPGRLLAGGQVVFEGPIRDHCFWILFDGIHHRAQLSTYIRPMGGKVPAIYGPSGDEAPTP